MHELVAIAGVKITILAAQSYSQFNIRIHIRTGPLFAHWPWEGPRDHALPIAVPGWVDSRMRLQLNTPNIFILQIAVMFIQ